LHISGCSFGRPCRRAALESLPGLFRPGFRGGFVLGSSACRRATPEPFRVLLPCPIPSTAFIIIFVGLGVISRVALRFERRAATPATSNVSRPRVPALKGRAKIECRSAARNQLTSRLERPRTCQLQRLYTPIVYEQAFKKSGFADVQDHLQPVRRSRRVVPDANLPSPWRTQ
jgi:hypothetical protein